MSVDEGLAHTLPEAFGGVECGGLGRTKDWAPPRFGVPAGPVEGQEDRAARLPHLAGEQSGTDVEG